MKGWLRLALGCAVSLVSLVLVFQGLHWSSFVQAVARADLGLLSLAAVFIVVNLFLRTFRWRVLFFPVPVGGVELGALFDSISIGYLASNVLPARLGDLIRPYALSRFGGPQFARSLSTVVVERVVDGLTVVSFLIALMPLLSLPSWATNAGLASGAVFVAALIALLGAARYQEGSHRIVSWLLRKLPLDGDEWANRVMSLVRGFGVLRNPVVLAPLVAWSLAVWLATAFSFHLVARAVGLDISFAAAVFGLCAIGLSMAVPSSPGQIGVFEGAGVLALMIFTSDYERAVSTVLVMHALSYVLLSGFGLWSLARRSLSYRWMLSQARQADEASTN